MHMHQLGSTRSVHRPDHLLQAPDSFVRTTLPGLEGGFAIVHASPQLGADFAMMTVELDVGGRLQHGPTQRFFFVLEGAVELHEYGSRRPHMLEAGEYGYLPANHAHSLVAPTRARVLVIDKHYVPLDAATTAALRQPLPSFLLGKEEELEQTPLNGDDDVLVRILLPPVPTFDFAVNTMTYSPGASLSQVESHVMEHGLLMLLGGGIYRLSDQWYPVMAGDFIWMAPFCPQWFGALGRTPAKYLIYKEVNRHVLA